MASKPFPAYEGDQPYLFVSYAHDDDDAVYAEMAWLHDAGINLWYDDGIHVGTVWRRALAQALSSAAGLVFFASARSALSITCRQEINFALDESKPIVVVHLDDVALPAELRLSLSDRQALHKSEFDEPTYRGRLTAALGPLVETPLVPPTDYLRWVEDDLAGISLLGLDAKDVNRAELGQVYVTALTPARTRPTGTTDELRLAQLIRRIEDGSLYVQGTPGSGKSTFCRWLALVVARGSMPELQSSTPEPFRETFPEQLRGHLPVLCALRDFYPKVDWKPDLENWGADEMEAAVARWIDIEAPGGLTGETFRRFLAEGGALVMFDGFDEVPASIAAGDGTAYPRAAILSGLRNALPRWIAAGNRILLTARPYGLTAEETQLLDLDETRLEALPQLLQELFIERWFATVDPTHAAARAKGLLAELDQRDDLDELRDSPMLLTGLCVKYLEGQRLPADIGDMYDALVSYVLHSRYGARGSAEVEIVRRRLGVIALAMHCGRYVGENAEAPPDDLLMQPRAHMSSIRIERALRAHNKEERLAVERDFSAHAVRDGLLVNSGLLRPRDENSAEFYHLSIQDFLGAERLDGLDVDVTAWLKRYTHEPRWRATFAFWFARMMRTPGSPARALRKMGWLRECLAADVFAEKINAVMVWADCLELAATKQDIGDYGEEFRHACMESMLASAFSAVAVARPRMFEVLGRLGLDDRTGVSVAADGLPDIEWVRVDSGEVPVEDGPTRLTVGPFEMARYPVTHRQFDAFVEHPDGYANAQWWGGLKRPNAPRSPATALPNVPRDTVSWAEATAYARWLSAMRGEPIRLPREEEWLLAAGNDWKLQLLANGMPVGVNRIGGPRRIEDLYGCLEWVETACNKDGVRDENGQRRVLKGSRDDRRGLRAAFRQSSAPEATYADVGFRLVREC